LTGPASSAFAFFSARAQAHAQGGSRGATLEKRGIAKRRKSDKSTGTTPPPAPVAPIQSAPTQVTQVADVVEESAPPSRAA
jgi:hypothetical protein